MAPTGESFAIPALDDDQTVPHWCYWYWRVLPLINIALVAGVKRRSNSDAARFWVRCWVDPALARQAGGNCRSWRHRADASY